MVSAPKLKMAVNVSAILIILISASAFALSTNQAPPKGASIEVNGDKFFIPDTFAFGRFGSGEKKEDSIDFTLDVRDLKFHEQPPKKIKERVSLHIEALKAPNLLGFRLVKEQMSRKIKDCNDFSQGLLICHWEKKTENESFPVSIYGDDRFLIIERNEQHLRAIISCNKKFADLPNPGCHVIVPLSDKTALRYAYNVGYRNKEAEIYASITSLVEKFIEGEK